uniref:Uncharacterized protein n=1 Tax=Strigamia maritima TaxID=126957 RepID=T1JN19_STRMM
MAAECKTDSRTFFTCGTPQEWKYILTVYKDAVRLKAQQKNKKPEELLKLDSWYQDELPKLIQSRKERHITHDELVQVMKWKLARGKWRPRLTDLVRMNTQLTVTEASRKAFKRLPNLARAVPALCTLKGVGPGTASAILAAASPECAPFMADECVLCMPNVDSVDYTVQEYLSFARQIQTVAGRLNECDKSRHWTAHRVEMALWTHYIVRELNPTLLNLMPIVGDEDGIKNGKSAASQVEHTKSSAVTSENGEDSSASTSKSEPDEETSSHVDETQSGTEDTNDGEDEQPLTKKSKSE